ncbi:MAG TPA: hypothetical protein VJP02_01040 [Candidatus Sulfotelmatobacter sp.]|nr:hypothetical protein [Candidatus Sulfotelmatobacter sp.]
MKQIPPWSLRSLVGMTNLSKVAAARSSEWQGFVFVREIDVTELGRL